MDMNKVELKLKMNAKGTHHIAYCEEYPSLQGIGPSEGQAIANFWKAFNLAEEKAAAEVSRQKKMERVSTESTNKKQTKRAA
ncbi:MAG: hypothetical protein J6Y94_06955 [Bacteriovoracaceae bacterium]|nr:hypothetical protein [Bacteriovoracaceae bacterium]